MQNHKRSPFRLVTALSKRISEGASFQQRLLLSFFLIAVPVLIGMAILFYILIHHTTDTSLLNSENSELEKISSQIEHILDDTENTSREVLYNSAVQKILTESQNGERFPEDSDVAYYMNNIISEQEYINFIVLTSTRYTVFSTEQAYTNYSSFSKIKEKWWYEDLISGKEPYCWYPNAASSEYSALANGLSQSRNDLMLARPIYSTSDYTTLMGYVMLYLDNDYLQDIWDSCSWGATTNILLYNSDGDLLASNSKTIDYSQLAKTFNNENSSNIIRLDGERYLCASKVMETDHYVLCMITPYKEVNDSVRILQLELFFTIAAIIFILILMSTISSHNMASPIISLSEEMDRFHSNAPSSSPELHAKKKKIKPLSPEKEKARLDSATRYRARTDEVGQIYRSFDELADRLNVLINEIYVKDLEKKDAELALLQSQINPHFLYNTLDSINWIALENDQDEISEMITALSDTFRLSLMKNNSSFTELSTEILYIQSYLVLQKLRYGETLNYDISISPGLPKLYIPRFILQPIVENSIKHGVARLENGGKLHIHVKAEKDLIITCINDGSDIDLEKMEEILRFNPEENEIMSFNKEGYGVQNINRRIKIICGSSYGLSYSKTDTETICTVTLPLKKDLL